MSFQTNCVSFKRQWLSDLNLDTKPGDVFLTITSFFAILVPGAIFVFLAVFSWSQVLPALPTGLPASFGPWIAFFVVSYLVGQFLYATGSWLLDPLYDWMDLGFKAPSRRGRIKAAENAARNKLLGGDTGSILPKARALILARGPQAWIPIEQADADSKFFRAVTLVAAFGTPLALMKNAAWDMTAVILGRSDPLLVRDLPDGRLPGLGPE